MAENIQIIIEAIDRASAQLASVQNAVNKMGTAASSAGNKLNTASKEANRLGQGLANLDSALQAVALGFGAREVFRFVNTIQELDNRIRLVTNSTGDLNKTYEKLFDVAQESRQSLDGTVNLYSKLALSADTLGLNTSQLTTVTENFNKALLVSGTSTIGANAALYQFAQGMQSGRIQGDELRTLLETTPKFMDILRKSTGLTTAELRKLASEGFLTSSIVAQALIDATDDLDANMAKMPKTLSQATTQMTNAMQKTVRSFLDATNGSEILVGAIDLVTDNIEILTVAVGALVAALAFGALMQAAAFAVRGLGIAAGVATTGIKGLTVALTFLAGNPIGRLISVLGIAAAAAMALKGDTDKTTNSSENLTEATDTLATSTKKNSGVTAEMTKLMNEQGITTAVTKTKFSELLDEIKSQIEYSGLFTDERKTMIDIDKALQETQEEGRKKNKTYTTEEIANMRERLVAAAQERDERLKVTAELETRYKDYLSFIKKSQDENLTDTEKYEEAVAQATKDRHTIQKFSEEDYQKYLEALRKEYSEKYFKIIQDSQMEELTETQKFQKDVSTLVDDYLNGRLSKEISFQEAKDAISVKYNKKLWDEAEKARQEEQGAFGIYSARMLELNDAYNAGRFKTDDQYYALANKARLDYVNATVGEYSTLYSTVETKLLDILNINKSNWPLIKDVVKLFGVDADKILKDLFVQGLQYIIGFKGSSVAQFTAMQGETNGIFSGIGSFINNLFSSSSSISTNLTTWANGAVNVFSQLYDNTGSVFNAIGGVISNIFSTGGGSFSTILGWVNKALDLFRGFGSSASNIFGGIGNFISGVFSGGGGSSSGGSSGGGSAINSIVSMGLDYLTGGLGSILSNVPVIGNVVNKVVGGVSKAVGSVVNGIKKLFSDRRLKTNIMQVGSISGLNLYEFDYKSGLGLPQGRHTGFMADEVKTVFPEAVGSSNGFDTVDYTRVLKGLANQYNVGNVNVTNTPMKLAAKGNAYSNGILNNATIFGTNQGHMAVGGEMGTEAIMPLSRDSNGRLGVSVNGGGAGAVNINFTINAVDARGVDELLMSRKSLITNIVRAGVSERGVKL